MKKGGAQINEHSESKGGQNRFGFNQLEKKQIPSSYMRGTLDEVALSNQ